MLLDSSRKRQRQQQQLLCQLYTLYIVSLHEYIDRDKRKEEQDEENKKTRMQLKIDPKIVFLLLPFFFV